MASLMTWSKVAQVSHIVCEKPNIYHGKIIWLAMHVTGTNQKFWNGVPNKYNIISQIDFDQLNSQTHIYIYHIWTVYCQYKELQILVPNLNLNTKF